MQCHFQMCSRKRERKVRGTEKGMERGKKSERNTKKSDVRCTEINTIVNKVLQRYNVM